MTVRCYRVTIIVNKPMHVVVTVLYRYKHITLVKLDLLHNFMAVINDFYLHTFNYLSTDLFNM